MPYDLRTEAWIPFLRRDGTAEWGSPSFLTDGLSGDNPIVDLAPPRPDFRGALLEFLIGLATVAFLPRTEEAWRKRWDTPPTPDEFTERLADLPDAFRLDGEYPRFMQDFRPLDTDTKPIAGLLIDMPGEQGLKNNTDVFQRGRDLTLGLPAAAMALITKQTYAPAGGAGYRTGLRGGGPLTTLIDPQNPERGERPPLWHKIWMNVPLVRALPHADDIPRIFPWMASTRHSNAKKGGKPTYPDDGHPLQQFFALPCRIRLEIQATEGCCDLTGEPSPGLAQAFETIPGGVQYLGWTHALSPHYVAKPGDVERLPLHGRTGGVGWRDWAGLIFGQKKTVGKGHSQTTHQTQWPAEVVSTFLNSRARLISSPRLTLHTFGYDMDNAKAREWTEGRMPLWPALNGEAEQQLATLSEELTAAAYNARSALRQAYRTAFYDHVHDKPDPPPMLEAALWAETEAPFFKAISQLAEGTAKKADDVREEFERSLRTIALRLFDETCPFNLVRQPRQQVEARNALRWALRTNKEREHADRKRLEGKSGRGKSATAEQGELIT